MKQGRLEKEPTIELNIVLLPDKETEKIVRKWSGLISDQLPTFFRLNSRTRIPHLSIYNSKFPERNRKEIYALVKELANGTDPFTINLDGFSSFAHTGFIFYDAPKKENKKIIEFHKKMVAALNPLREGLLADVLATLKNLPPNLERAIDQFGTPSAMELYIPHITITRVIDSGKTQGAISLLPRTVRSVRAREVAITLFREHGTVPLPLVRFPLGR